MTITLIRHTEVEEAYHRCYNGHIDIRLSEAGHKQAEKLAEHFTSHSFDAVFCSDLIRTKDTLKYFEHSKDAVYSEKLREKSWGKHEGLTFDEIIAQKEISYNNFMQWINDLDGESYELYIQRIEKFFLEFLPSLDKENILVITHAGVIRVLMSIVQKLSLEEAFGISVPYSSYVLFDSEKKEFSEVKYINDAIN